MTSRLMLGLGARAGIWVLGCTIGCRGYASRDTWEADPSRLVDVGQLADWLGTLPGLYWLTVTSDKPFQQSDSVRALLSEVHTQAARQGRRRNILVYSGYTYAVLTRRPSAAAVLALYDTGITGPYIDRLNPCAAWRRSADQKLTVLTELGRERFRSDEDAGVRERRPQVSCDGRRLCLLGIPGCGDPGQVEHEQASRGLTVEGQSWRD